MKALLRKISQILRNKRTRRLLMRTVGGFSAVIVFVTTYALILPAITMEAEADCGIEAHQHDDSCYEEMLICDLPESDGHHHTSTCYNDASVLVCGLEETEGHTHDSSCYEKVLTCEKEAHTHSAACYHRELETFMDAAVAADPSAASTASTAVAAASSYDAADLEYDEENSSSDDGTAEDSGSDIDLIAPEEADSSADYASEAEDSSADYTPEAEDSSVGSEPEEEDYSADFAPEAEDSDLTNTGDAPDAASNAASTSADSLVPAEGTLSRDSYVPALDPLNFDTILTDRTGIYYYAPSDGELIENSSTITDWKKTEEDTELGRNDILRVYLAYTIPAGALNETNETARYRLPANLHLTDDQVKAINESENGIAGQYVNYDTLEITDPDQYHKYLGAEAVESTRTPSDDLAEYLEKHADQHDGQEYISAVVKVEDAYDDQGDYLGQDLVFTFTPYSVQKNRHEYDCTGQPTKAGRKISGWFTLDFNMEQVDWSEPEVTTYELPEEEDETPETEEDSKNPGAEEKGENPAAEEMDENLDPSEEKAENTDAAGDAADSADDSAVTENAESTPDNSDPASNHTKVITIERSEQTADIVFVPEGTDSQNNPIHEIHTELTLVEETRIETIAEKSSSDEEKGDAEETGEETKDISEEAQDETDQANDAAADETAEAAEPAADSSEELPSDKKEDSSPEYKDGTLTSEGTGYKITLDYKADAQIPENAYLKVSEITRESDPEAYEACLKEAEKTIPTDDKTTVDDKASRFFDIEILVDEIVMPQTDESEEKEDEQQEASAEQEQLNQEAETETENEAVETVDGAENTADSVETTDSVETADIEETADSIETGDSTETTETITRKIEPAAPVSVNIQLFDTEISENVDNYDAEQYKVVHFAEEGTQEIQDVRAQEIQDDQQNSAPEKTADEAAMVAPATEIQFEAEGFSIYGVVYTVDFHWNVDGKTYDFSIPGGGFVSLEHLVEVLGIATTDENSGNEAESAENDAEGADEFAGEVPGVVDTVENQEDGSEAVTDADDSSSTDSTAYEEAIRLNDVEVSEATKKFVAGVESVEFSSPELVWVGKVDEEKTVGGLKEANELEIEYSADLTEDQIEEINAQTVEAGDWALISVHPFTTEETLTITMKNGDQFVVKVTDYVEGVFARQTDIEIIGDGSISLTEYINPLPWDWMDMFSYEDRRTYYSGRTVYLSVKYGLNTNNQSIVANPAPGYVFDHWEINGHQLTGSVYDTAVIEAGALQIMEHDTLTAVFTKGSGGGGTHVDFSEMMQEWIDKITKDQPKVDKTAEVYDYENRIYKVDISASSELYAVNQRLDLDFVTDVSGSMLFPSKMDVVEEFNNSGDLISSLDQAVRANHNGNLPASTSAGELYYIILNPQAESDVFVVRKYNGTWYRLAAAYTDEEINQTVIDPANSHWRELTAHDNGGNVIINGLTPDRIIEKKIYMATDMTKRLVYLKEALYLTRDVLYKIDPDAKIGLTTFWRVANQGRFYTATEQDQLTNDISNIATDGGTNQADGLEKGKALLDSDQTSDVKKVALLITDGAPNGITWDQVYEKADALKNAGIDVYTVGLSVQNVQGASAGLDRTSSNSIPGQHGFAYEARDGRGLVEAIQSIIESMTTRAMMTGDISDTIDPAFYPVDKYGNPLELNVEYEDDGGHRYMLTKQGDTWTVTWKNQDIDWARPTSAGEQPGWKGTVYVKAKENFLGGNKIKTNSGTQADKVTVTGFKTIIDEDGTVGNSGPLKNEDGTLKTITKKLATPRVNVDELKLTDEDTSWTVYVDATVDPMSQLKNLYKNIDVSEVVTQTGTDHRRTALGALNPDHDGDSETFPLTDITGELTNAQWNTLLGGGTITVPYGTENPANANYAYGHANVGKIQISLSKTYATGENQIASSTETGHTANKAGANVEQYTLTVRYVPDTTGASTTYDHVPDGKAGAITENMTSVNEHGITVIRRGVKVTKVDMVNTNQTLTGAKFALYRADPNGTADISGYDLPTGKYTLVQSNLEVDGNGVITFDSLKPDQKPGNNPGIYLPDNPVGNTAAYHDTCYYLVETSPATGGYVVMPGSVCFTLNLEETKADAIDRTTSYHGRNYKNDLTLYNWTQTAAVTASEVGNGATEYLVTDTGTDEILAFKLKNARPTDITLIKVDKNTGESIGGAKFSLVRGSENVDLTQLTIIAINGGATVTPENYNYNGTTIKVVTVPEGGIRIAGLADDTYTLREVVAPAGYITTDSGKIFKTENGAIKNADDSAHTNEATDIAFKVENEPGVALPNTGGPGTRLIYLFGLMLTVLAGVGLVMKRRRRTTA